MYYPSAQLGESKLRAQRHVQNCGVSLVETTKLEAQLRNQLRGLQTSHSAKVPQNTSGVGSMKTCWVLQGWRGAHLC